MKLSNQFRRIRLTLALMIGLVALLTGLPSGVWAQNGQTVPGQVVIVFNQPFYTPATVSRVTQQYGQIIGRIDPIQTVLLQINPTLTTSAVETVLRRRKEVAAAEDNPIVTASSTPDDPLYAGQYAPMLIKADLAWDAWLPVAAVTLAVVDTGVDITHPDLMLKILSGPTGPIGYNSLAHTPGGFMDDNGHGTHVAGIAAAQVDNGVGIAGIAGWDGMPGVSDTIFTNVMPVKVLDASGMGTAITVSEGIVWAADHGANVINMSLGSILPSTAEQKAVDHAWGKGCVLVAAAGNEGIPAKHYPAAYGNVISVAATDPTDTMASFSNYGIWVNVTAPGVAILSTLPTYPVTLTLPPFSKSPGYDMLSGTSQATPHVAGDAALIMAAHPELSNYDVRKHIKAHVDPYSPIVMGMSHPIMPGGGRINVLKGLLDATTSVWTTKAAMPTSRAWLAATTGLDGLIYVTGGYHPGAFSGVVSTVEVYHPDTDSWTTATPMSTARGLHASVTLPDGHIMVLGGTSGIPGALLGSAEQYDPAAGIWEALPPMPTARWGLGAAVGPDGKVYAIGGSTDYPGLLYPGAVATAEMYDPVKKIWTKLPPMKNTRVDLVVLAGPDGLIYAIGGMSKSGAHLKSVEVYSPLTKKWSLAPTMSTARALMAGAKGKDGQLYLFGGFSDGAPPFDAVQAYNALSASWSTLPPLLTPRFRLAAATGPDGTLYTFGGTDDYSDAFSTVEAFTP